MLNKKILQLIFMLTVIIGFFVAVVGGIYTLSTKYYLSLDSADYVLILILVGMLFEAFPMRGN